MDCSSTNGGRCHFKCDPLQIPIKPCCNLVVLSWLSHHPLQLKVSTLKSLSPTCPIISVMPATYLLTVGMILNLIPPEPPVRGTDQIFSFCVPPKRGSEKIIYCSKIGGTFAYCWYFCWYKSNCKT